jgi:hypothetical protein
MKMNPKADALSTMAEEGGDYKEPSSEAEDMKEDKAEGESSVKCQCGCDVVCKDCMSAPEDCNC